MTDQEIARLPRRQPPYRHRLREQATRRYWCDQCGDRLASCTVPVMDSRTRQPVRKEYWCSTCREQAFPNGAEVAWFDAQGRVTTLGGQMVLQL